MNIVRLNPFEIRARVLPKELVELPKRKDRISGVTIRPVAIPPEQGALF